MAKRKANNLPKLHVAVSPSKIDLGTLLRMAAETAIDGVKFDGIDLCLSTPHCDIDATDDDLKRLAETIQAAGLEIGTIAPTWSGGNAWGSETERATFLAQVRKACNIAQQLRKLGVRPFGSVQVDTAASVEQWAQNPDNHQKLIAKTFTEACEIAAEFDEVLACSGQVNCGGIHSWRRMLQILEMVDRPQTLGFQANMAQTLQYLSSPSVPEDRLLPENVDNNFAGNDQETFEGAYRRLTRALRIWTVDLRVAPSDDKSSSKLDISRCAGHWLRDEDGLTKRFLHVCWDGRAFSGENQQAWHDALETMIAVRNDHGWK